MSRWIYQGTTRDGNGRVILSATVSVYLSGTDTAASIYTASTGGTAVNSVTSSSTNGSYSFYVDDTDYDSTQFFKVTFSKPGYESKSWDNINIIGVFSPSSTSGIYTSGGITYVITATIAAIQAAIDAASAGATIRLIHQTYTGTVGLTIDKSLVLEGGNDGGYVNLQLSTDVTGITIASNFVTVRGLQVQSTYGATATGYGVYSSATSNITVERVRVAGFYAGFYITGGGYNAAFRDCVAISSHYYGFYLAGYTSVVVERCYANGYAVAPGPYTYYGYYLNGLKYSSLLSCASDNMLSDGVNIYTGNGYFLSNCWGVSLSGCGAESCDASAIYSSLSYGITVNSFFSVDNNTEAAAAGSVFHAVNTGSINLNGLYEYSYTSAGTYSAIFEGSVSVAGDNWFLQKDIYSSESNTIHKNYSVPDWQDGSDATYSSGTTVTVTGDVTATYKNGTLIRALIAAGRKVFGVVNTATYSAPDTTIVLYQGVLVSYASLHLEYVNPVNFLHRHGGTHRFVCGSTGGLNLIAAEAIGTPSGTTTYFDIPTSVPSGVMLKAVQLRVDTALTAGETWGAKFITGSTLIELESLSNLTYTTIPIAATGTAVAKNTKVNLLFCGEITTGTTNIRITRDSGNFTNAVGVIRAIVYYESLTTMANAA